MNEENKNIIEEEDSSIDFGKIFKDLLNHKMLYVKVLPVAFVLAAVYALSLPNFYSCTVKLSPEMGGSKTGSSSLASLASSFGVNLGSTGAGTEALFPTLYPELMNSVDFKTALFPVKVTRETDGKTFTYYDYLMNEQKTPWWNGVFHIFSDKEVEKLSNVNPFKLTKEQTDIVKAINKNVVCDVDKKTMVITINVTDQDPLICATMADSVKTRLQKFITDYRTSKVRVDLAYNQKLYKEAKSRYEKARQRYAEFSDANQDVILQAVQTKLTDLENEMQLQYNNYTTLSAQLLSAKAKVQEETPAFTTLQRATVPLGPTGPRTKNIVLLALFMAIVLTTIFVLFKENQLRPLLGIS